MGRQICFVVQWVHSQLQEMFVEKHPLNAESCQSTFSTTNWD
jgi:hypothetical protein